MLAIFLAALLFGFAFNVSPGAVFSETLRRGLTGGFRPALLVQLGSLIGDAVWALLGLTGLALLLGYEQVRIPLTLACAAYLAWLGVQGLRDAWS
ncbi:LysE family transporter, partial [Pseudomonas aeruginosa]|nr:LysE family transporter [Pseudomonas aeruginosa]